MAPSTFKPDTNNWLVQYKHFLFEFTLTVASIASMFIGMLHYFGLFQYVSIEHAYHCIILSFYEAMLLIIYRRNSDHITVLAWFSIIPVQMLLFSNIVYSTGENVRTLWFCVVLIPAQYLGGARLGLTVFISSVVIVTGYQFYSHAYHETDLISSISILTICYIFVYFLQHLLQRADNEISRYQHDLRIMVIHDGLTGIYNRRFFEERLEQEWARSLRSKTPLALIMLDVDYFKNYNDDYGHIQGDECLKHISKFMDKSLERQTDMLFRYGGEEFAIILPDTGVKGAYDIAEMIRLEIEQLDIKNIHSPLGGRITISGGICAMQPESGDTRHSLLECADKNLYRAKKLGRNQIIATCL